MRSLGIDFGTTFTKAAIFDSDKKETTLVELNPENTDFGFGRTKYAMPTVVLVNVSAYNKSYEVGHKAQNLKRFPGTYVFENFKIHLDDESDFARVNPDISYVELIQAILLHVYNTAKLQVLSDFDNIVITVPASCVKNSLRWNRMLESAKNVFGNSKNIDIIYEPEAAGFALLNDSLKTDRNINGKNFLIYDFGGGTFDVSVFQVIDEQIFVIGESVGSDDQKRWGGAYIDDILRKDYRTHGSIINTLIADIDNLQLTEQMKIEETLRMEPIKAKIALSSQNQYKFSLLDYILTKNHFEFLVRPMIEDTIDCSESLVDSKEEEGSPLALRDISKIFLVGGSSKIGLVSSIWNEKKSNDPTLEFELSFANIEIVAVGAAMYQYLKIKPDRLIELGVVRMLDKNYSRAALYFRNANTPDGNYLLGLLYFNGLIGNKRNFVKAVHYFNLSGNEKANMMLAFCAYQGRHGLPRNHNMAAEYLKKSGNYGLSNSIRQALANTAPSQTLLNSIYNFDSIADVMSQYNAEQLKKKMTDNQETKLESSAVTDSVKPCNPDLDYLHLMGLINRL